MKQAKVVYLALEQLEPHPDVQRTLDTRWAEKIAEEFDPDLYGFLSVVPDGRPDRYWIFDGQHRHSAALKAANRRSSCPSLAHRRDAAIVIDGASDA